MTFNFDPYRAAGGAIDLAAAYEAAYPNRGVPAAAREYLRQVMDLHPITSRQAAAQALTTAPWLSVLS